MSHAATAQRGTGRQSSWAPDQSTIASRYSRILNAIVGGVFCQGEITAVRGLVPHRLILSRTRGCGLFFQVAGRERALLFRDLQQCGIELHKCGIDGRMLLVARVALGCLRNLLRRLALVITKEGPSTRKAAV